jgi:hypothetical protein
LITLYTATLFFGKVLECRYRFWMFNCYFLSFLFVRVLRNLQDNWHLHWFYCVKTSSRLVKHPESDIKNTRAREESKRTAILLPFVWVEAYLLEVELPTGRVTFLHNHRLTECRTDY